MYFVLITLKVKGQTIHLSLTDSFDCEIQKCDNCSIDFKFCMRSVTTSLLNRPGTKKDLPRRYLVNNYGFRLSLLPTQQIQGWILLLFY